MKGDFIRFLSHFEQGLFHSIVTFPGKPAEELINNVAAPFAETVIKFMDVPVRANYSGVIFTQSHLR